MKVTVKDLIKGDEILIPFHFRFIYAKVLKDASISYHSRKDINGNKVPRVIHKYGDDIVLYKKVWCSVNAIKHSDWTEYLPTGEGHNLERQFDLNGFGLWLLTERELQK